MASTSGEGDVQGHNLVVKTGRNPSEWKKNIAKRKRNSGEEYESSVTRKVVKKNEIGAPCRDGCFEKMGMNNIKAIHESFWGLGDFNLQNAFIQKFCVKGVVKRRRVRVRGDAPPRRSCTRSYSFLCGDNVIPVCATAFRSVLSISTKRLHTAVESVTPTGTPRVDRRGKHVPKHAMPASRKNLVEQHVKSFPTVSSHYTRAKSPLMRYLDTDMTLKKMFFLYKEWLFDTNEEEEPVKFSYYKKVVRRYRLGFKPPNTDTCSKCDRYEVSKKDASTEEEAVRIQADWDDHLRFAKEGMKAMKKLQEDDDPNTRYHVIALKNTDFLDVEVLQQEFTHRKPKPPYSFQEARSFELRTTFSDGYFICMDYTGEALGSVRLMKGQARLSRHLFDLSQTQLPQKYPQKRRLQSGKVEHLQQLMRYIPEANQQYLQYIIRKQQELDDEDSSEDEDDDVLQYDSEDETCVDDPQPRQE
ncbi:hypothetical protein Pmani_002678 [Petrolisthes manimaculis]|uniref:Uncharacterized protein n=1 Tax=Petrolisthes manimaculis TaxID=1843537 RepID=A0AAE1QHE3_9EUCA|nr:hypothetical protein Pmani_002678 [Petrolisthes manimaculis]